MKITLYTTTDDPFSKQEKDYLTAHNMQFEEKNLETNKEFLTEMLAVSNNFAGTPVTKVEKDDGTISVIKGFTQAEFDTALGLAAAPTPPTPGPAMPTSPTTPTPSTPTPSPEPSMPPPVTEPTPTPTPSQPPEAPPIPPETPAEPTPTNPPINQSTMPSNDALNTILEDLQKKAAETPTAAPATNSPRVPDFPATP